MSICCQLSDSGAYVSVYVRSARIFNFHSECMAASGRTPCKAGIEGMVVVLAANVNDAKDQLL